MTTIKLERSIYVLAIIGAITAFSFLGIALTTGISQEPFQVVHAPGEYVELLKANASVLRAVLTIDNFFIISYTTFFILFAMVFEINSAFCENLSPRFFGSLRLAQQGDDFKFFFGDKFFQFRKLRFERHHLSFFAVCRFSCVDKVFHNDLEKPAFGLDFIQNGLKFPRKTAGEPA